MNFSESIAACDLEFGRCTQLFQLMKAWETSAQTHLCMKIETGFSQKIMGHFESNFVYKLS